MQKEITVSMRDIHIFIGLAASEVASKYEGKEREFQIMKDAADICNIVSAHLTGERKFSEEEIDGFEALYKLVENYEHKLG